MSPRLDATVRMAPFHSGITLPHATGPRQILARARELLREGGPRAVWFAALARLAYRRDHLYEQRLDGRLPSPDASPHMEFEELPADRAGELASFRRHLSEAYIAHCFAAGHRCLIARADGRALGVTWFAEDRIWSDFLECQIPLAEDEAYGFATFVLAEARRRGVGPALLAYRARALAESGHRRLFLLVDPENPAGVRLAEKLGSRLATVIGHYRLGRRRWYFFRPRSGVVPPGTRA